MRFRRDAPLALIGAVVAVVAVLTAASSLLFGGMTSAVEQSQVDLMRAIVSFNIDGAGTNALARAEMLASDPMLRDAMARRDRPYVLAHTEAMFAEQRDKYGVDQVQFHIPPATSFLRLQAPDKFGDDLTAFRPIVVAVNREHTAKKGVAIAKTGPAIFGVAPIRGPAGDHVGSVEFGMDIGVVLDRLKAAYGLELTLFLDEGPLRQFATGLPPSILIDENRVGSTIKYHSTNWALMRELVTADDLRAHGQTSDYARSAMGASYGVVIVPIRNGAGQVLGAIAVAKSFESTRGAAGRSLVIQILFAVFAVIALAGVILVVVRGWLLRPLAAIAARFATVDTEEPAEDDEDDDKLAVEMSELAAQYRRIACLQSDKRSRR